MIGVCMKWVDHRPEIDPLTADVRTDPRTSGPSDADQAALEWALRLAARWGDDVVAACAGPAGCEPMLRDAVAAGASRAVRVDTAPSSEAVAAGLAAVLGAADLVVCGAWSLDGGSGSVPAFLAARLDAAQALGLISMEAAAPGELRAERRLDGGRRERLEIRTPAVVSVEAGTARLRRASLDAVLAARGAPVSVVTGPGGARRAAGRGAPGRRVPMRPRPRTLAAPAGADARARVLALTGALSHRPAAQTVFLEPAAAADEILDRLRAWGYLT